MSVLLTVLWGCSSPTDTSTPEGMAALADTIAADPSKGAQALQDAGVDEATFEARLYEIAADPAQTDAYLAARKR